LLIFYYYVLLRFSNNYDLKFQLFVYFFYGLVLLVFLRPKLLYSRFTWFVLLVFYWIYLIEYWLVCNNHDILFGYFFIVFFTSLFVPTIRRESFLSKNCSYLIGLIFLFSIIHKWSSPSFLSGYVIFQILLTWESYLFLDVLLPMDYQAVVATNAANFERFLNHQIPFKFLIGTKDLFLISKLITFSALIIESLIAVLFLLPKKLGIVKYRDYVLIAFMLTTYFPLKITGFFYILFLLGITQTTSKDKRIRLGYICLILVYTVFNFHLLD